MSLLGRARTYLEIVKFEHTVFALPFALAAGVFAAGGKAPSAARIALVIVAVVFARTAAMAMNRYADSNADALNPRTKARAVPAGLVSRGSVLALSLASAGLFTATAWLIGPLAFTLSPVVLAVVLGYSYAKRFTWLCHFWLGAALALAPLGASVAVAGTITPAVWLLAAGVLFWTAGFDIIYATQDLAFDLGHATHSLPARLGLAGALRASAACHAASVVMLTATGLAAGLGGLYFTGVGALAVVLAVEHLVVRPSDLSRVNLAFFTLNGFVSLGYFGVVVAERYLV
jgi:4-hydroxybenzoate polyprenyltransferase